MAKTEPIYEYRELVTFQDGDRKSDQRCVVKEIPLTIMVNGCELITLVCSPHSLEYLAIGFLASEGFVQKYDDINQIRYESEHRIIWIDIKNDAIYTKGNLWRKYSNSYGKKQIAMPLINDCNLIPPISHDMSFSIQEIFAYITLLNMNAKTFKVTGGVHEAALAHKGEFVVFLEDISRHNVLDKIIGYTFTNAIDTFDKVLVLSSRIASDMLIKAARMGIPVVVSRSAPTCLSIDLAEKFGITLIGFARGKNLNVYTHPERVVEFTSINTPEMVVTDFISS